MTATDRLYAEMGALAAAFAWSRDSLMSLEHAERRRWVSQARAQAGVPALGGPDDAGPGRPRWP